MQQIKTSSTPNKRLGVVLYQPQIPPNTGNIVRTCAVTGSSLVLVQPGFSTSDRWLKRAGLDYWEGVSVSLADHLVDYLQGIEAPFYFFSSKAPRCYSSVQYSADAVLVFGSEVSGLPEACRQLWPDRFLTIPMLPGVRCLNLATSVGIVVYEAWRQQRFEGTLHH